MDVLRLFAGLVFAAYGSIKVAAAGSSAVVCPFYRSVLLVVRNCALQFPTQGPSCSASLLKRDGSISLTRNIR